MSRGPIRRRLSQWTARHDWLEGWVTVFGVLFLVVAALCVYAFATLILSYGDSESGFPAGEGKITGSKGLGLVFFPVAGLVAFVVGWSLAGDRVRALARRLRRGPDDET